MSQSEVGRKVGLSRSAVTQIESGNRDVTADEVVRFSAIFRHSPTTLLTGVGQAAGVSVAEKDRILDDIIGALLGWETVSAGLRADIERLIELSRQLTRIEDDLGVDVYAPQAFTFRGTNSRTHWEAAHQGYAVAEDERRRLDLGSAPIRDVPEAGGAVAICPPLRIYRVMGHAVATIQATDTWHSKADSSLSCGNFRRLTSGPCRFFLVRSQL